MYSAISSRDALKRFLGDAETGTNLIPDQNQLEFGIAVVAIAEQLHVRLKSKGWDTHSIRGYDVGSLMAMSIRCLRSLGSEVQSSENGLVLNRHIFFSLLVALTSLLERLVCSEA